MAPLARSPRTAPLPLLQETSGSLSQSWFNQAQGWIWQLHWLGGRGHPLWENSSWAWMGKKSFYFSQDQSCLGCYAYWWISVYLHRPAPLLCRKEPSWVPDGFPETASASTCLQNASLLFASGGSCLALQTQAQWVVVYLLFPNKVSLHLIASFVSSYVTLSVSKNFFFFFFYSHLEISPDTREGSRSPPGLRIPSISFQILSNILLAAVSGHRTNYWWYRHPSAVIVCQP